MRTRSLVLSLLAVILFAQCKKEEFAFRPDNTTYNVNIFTDMENLSGLKLYINDQYKGTLPYLNYTPVCGEEGNKEAHPARMVLKSGTYEILAKDEEGNILSGSTLRFSKCYMSVSGGGGGGEVVAKDDCMTYRVF